MGKAAQMNWYKQESERALSRLETLLTQKTLTKPEDFEGTVSNEVYSILTKIPKERRPEFKYLADILVNYLGDCLDKTCLSGNPAQIAERAVFRKKIDDLKTYFPDQPCV